MSKRRVKIPVVLVFALVQGMWMGAQVHGLSAGHASPLHRASPLTLTALCGCRAPAGSQPVLQKSAGDCVACAIGALMQDSPALVAVSLAPAQVIDVTPPAAAGASLTPALPLHPGRGPPAIA